ncbi:hypothetical protein [Actinomyces naeslundii]|uniref:hypothetical protein n=1 Tax=Actinomyces naeslundii TaxID=1655 RepID=UPI00195E3B7C|nr:hypothetical protein [Actinomyces naeslundii]
MIITEVNPHESWVCLARRGMLFSETESIELFRLNEGDRFSFSHDSGVDELLLVLHGKLKLYSTPVRRNGVILISDKEEGYITALDDNTIVLSVTGYALRITSQLPKRIPELDSENRTL